MKKPILKLTLFCIIVLYSNGSVSAKNSESTCHVEHNRCEESCDRKHKTPKKDVWGNPRRESDITRWHKEKCKDRCLGLKNFCIERKNKIENSEKTNEEPENVSEESSAEDTSLEYPSIPTSSNLYKWTDKKG